VATTTKTYRTRRPNSAPRKHSYRFIDNKGHSGFGLGNKSYRFGANEDKQTDLVSDLEVGNCPEELGERAAK